MSFTGMPHGKETRMAIECRIGGIGIGDGHPVRLMGIVNVSDESFYDGSVYKDKDIASAFRSMAAGGASIIDIGGRSTAPKSAPVSIEEEEFRVRAALTEVLPLLKESGALLSIDTQYRKVAETAWSLFEQLGCTEKFILNDVSGLRTDPSLVPWVARKGIPVVLMATHERPGDSLGVEETLSDLGSSMALLEGEGYPVTRKVIVDPAIGRWTPQKTEGHDLEVIHRLSAFRALGCPILAGISRKSFVGAVLGKKDPADRFQGTLAATAIAVYNGAHLIRTHDINDDTIDTIRMAKTIRDAEDREKI